MFIPISEPNTVQQGPQFALWNLAFRPFYLGAAALSAMSIAQWVLGFSGMVDWIHPINPLVHAHEMIFGYALAILVGFLLTAVRMWTGLETVNGRPLAALFGLWLAARLLILTPYLWLSMVSNVLFVFSAAFAVAMPLLKSRNQRNYLFIAALAMFGAGTTVIHGTLIGWWALPAWLFINMQLDVLLIVMVVMTGRIVPMFSNNGIPGLGATKHRLIDILGPISIILLLLADIAEIPANALAALAALATLIHASRLLLWRSWKTAGTPLVWVLHLAYAWVVLHLLLRCFAVLNVVDDSLATHALTAGALSTLTLGMMVRTARGHLGMPLQASTIDTIIFTSITFAGLLRVLLPIAAPAMYLLALKVASVLWFVSYGLYIIQYGPRLCRPRVDGKAG